MQPPTAPAKDSRNIRKWVIGCFLIFPIVCCGGTALFLRRWVDTFDYSADLDHQVAEARKHGLPIDLQDLAKGKSLSEKENAFFDLQKTMKDLPHAEKINAETVKFKPARGAKVPAKVTSLVTRARIVASKPGYDADHKYAMGLAELYPDYKFLKWMGAALSKTAQQEAIDGNVDAAIRDLESILKLSRLLNREKVLIGGLVSISLDQSFLIATMKVAGHLEGNDAAVRRITELLSQKLALPDHHEIFLGEVFVGVTTARNFKAFGGLKAIADPEKEMITPKRVRESGNPTGALERGMMAAYLGHMIALSEIFKHERNLAVAGQKVDDYVAKIPLTVSNSLTQIEVPIWHPAGVAWEKHVMSRQIALQAIELMRMRRRGALPREIKEIPDRLGDGPILYVRTANGFMIYSRGQNGVDDGGPKDALNRKTSDDYGFEYPFVSK